MKMRSFLTLVIVTLTLASCGDGALETSVGEEETISGVESALSSSKRRHRAKKIRDVAARRGLEQGWLLAGIADAETHLTHCWSEATWACQGPSSRSCGGGPVIAGSGDGPCYLKQGGLGMFQFDAGTFSDTLRRDGRKVLSLGGNVSEGLDFAVGMVIRSRYIGGVSTRSQALRWMNKVRRPRGNRFKRWVKTVTHYYNGCAPNYSCWGERYSRYRRYAKNIYREMGSNFWKVKRYKSKLWVRLARHADDSLKDGKSKGVADVFEYQRPKGYIYYKNQSNRTLKNVYLKYDYSENYLHARKYLIQRKKKGQRRWRTSGKLHGDSRNPARNKFGSRSTLFLGDMKPGEYRRIVIYFKAKQYSLHKKHDVRLRAWIRTISGGVYRGGRTYGTKPKKNKFKRRKRAQAKIDILAKEEWRFNGPTRKDTEGWRSCNNSSTGPRRIYKRTSRNGALVVEVRGKNGCVKSPKWTKINADGYDELVLRVKSKHGPHKSAVYFNTRKDQRWSSSRGVIFDARGDGTWQTLVIPMGGHPEWKGMIRRIRIDPLEGQGPRTGGIEKHQIDKVFLQRSDEQKTSSPREDYVTRTPVPVELSL